MESFPARGALADACGAVHRIFPEGYLVGLRRCIGIFGHEIPDVRRWTSTFVDGPLDQEVLKAFVGGILVVVSRGDLDDSVLVKRVYNTGDSSPYPPKTGGRNNW